MKMRSKIIVLSVFLGLLLWVIDAVVDSVIFHADSFLNSLIFRITAHELYMRMIILIYFLVIGCIVSIIMSRQRLTEKALRESEEKLRSIFSSMDDLVFVLDTHGIITDYYQPPEKESLFISPEIFLGKSFKEVLPPLVIQPIETAIHEVVTRKTSENIDYFLEIDGKEQWFNVKLSILKDASGKFAGVTAVSRDITDRKNIEKALSESEKMSRTLLEAAPEGIIVVDSNGVIELVNSSTEMMTGYTRDELIGQKIEIVVPELLRTVHREHRANYMSNPFSRSMETGGDLHCQRKDGSVFPIELGLNHIEVKDGIHVIALMTDITERKKAEKELEEAARTDSLTGLSNRRDFNEKFKDETGRFERNHKPFSIVMGDIDYFKKINDTYGHDCGDTVLQKIADLMRASLRHQDSVGRWGGEEFIILLPETGLKGGVQSAEKIRQRIQSEQFDHDGKSITVTMSFGVSIFDHSLSMEDVINVTDERLYKAKAAGRNRVVADE